MRPASFLSPYDQKIAKNQPTSAVRPFWSTNVPLPTVRGKLRDLLYNTL